VTPVVLDTNVVLDWHLFRDPRARALFASLEAGALRWHVTKPMIGELEVVWSRSFAVRWAVNHSATELADVLSWATVCTAEGHRTPAGLQCSDRSDQKFIDLAWHLQAPWLVTRDRALLKLANRARRFQGLNIVTPERWVETASAGPVA
jgi:predicted nucleic acid-binding protein